MAFRCERCHPGCYLFLGLLSRGPCECCGKVASCADCRHPLKLEHDHKPRSQTEVLGLALYLGAPDILAKVSGQLGTIVDCLNASGYRLDPK